MKLWKWVQIVKNRQMEVQGNFPLRAKNTDLIWLKHHIHDKPSAMSIDKQTL